MENYVANEWYQKKVLSKKPVQEVIKVDNLDYKLFKLFHLSILFRASVSSKAEYEHVKLGPHENKIKDLILNDNPGPKNRYTFLGTYLTHKGKVLDGIIMQPLPSKLESHKIYVFFFGGVQWNYFVSNHTPTEYLDILYTGNDLILAGEEFTENKFIRDFGQQYRKST